MADPQALELALLAYRTLRTPAQITRALNQEGRRGLERRWEESPAAERTVLHGEADALRERGVSVAVHGDDDFPQAVVRRGKPLAPMLFLLGNRALLAQDGIAIGGARSPTERALEAARVCSEEIASRRLAVVSGYAKGVDTQAHLAALRSGGTTVMVLAEGIDHFRIKRDYGEDFRLDRTLVVSQFPPAQVWRSYNAMTRNKLTIALSRALVVVQAGETGGTLAAGQSAMQSGCPVFALDFGNGTPAGNRLLISEGARPVRRRQELGDAIESILGEATPTQEQLPL